MKAATPAVHRPIHIRCPICGVYFVQKLSEAARVALRYALLPLVRRLPQLTWSTFHVKHRPPKQYSSFTSIQNRRAFALFHVEQRAIGRPSVLGTVQPPERIAPMEAINNYLHLVAHNNLTKYGAPPEQDDSPDSSHTPIGHHTMRKIIFWAPQQPKLDNRWTVVIFLRSSWYPQLNYFTRDSDGSALSQSHGWAVGCFLHLWFPTFAIELIFDRMRLG